MIIRKFGWKNMLTAPSTIRNWNCENMFLNRPFVSHQGAYEIDMYWFSSILDLRGDFCFYSWFKPELSATPIHPIAFDFFRQNFRKLWIGNGKFYAEHLTMIFCSMATEWILCNAILTDKYKTGTGKIISGTVRPGQGPVAK